MLRVGFELGLEEGWLLCLWAILGLQAGLGLEVRVRPMGYIGVNGRVRVRCKG